MNLLAEKYLPIRTNTDATVHVGPNTDQFPTLLGLKLSENKTQMYLLRFTYFLFYF